jgi:hypothetical protein
MREPARALVYLLAVGYFVMVAFLRSHRQAHMLPSIPEPYASALFLAYVALLGITMYGAASGIVGAFSSAADARFLIGSLIGERTVALWLQLRRSGTAIARMMFTMLLYALVFYHGGTFAGIGLAMIGGTIIATSSAIPMLKLRRVIGTRTAQSLAGAIAAIGILPMMILFAGLTSNVTAQRWAAHVERLGFGGAFNALFHGHSIALAALYAFAAVMISLSFLAGLGLYPDLYSSSLRVLAFRERQRRGTAAFTVEHRYEQRAARDARLFAIVRGPWTIVWKEWIAFMRSPSMQRMFVFGLVVSAAVGAVFGNVIANSKSPIDDMAAFASVAGNMIVIFVAMGSAIGLAQDIAKPLWWIGGDPLWTRLVAWTVGTSWRLAVILAAGIAAWAITMHAAVVAFAGIPIAIAAVLYLRGVGLALYSLFPSTIDQRGPLAMVRALLTYILAAPPVIVAAVIGFVSHNAPVGVICGVACSLLETMLLIAFASIRIAGQGVAFARAEAL